MSEHVVSRAGERAPWGPREWVTVGIAVLVVAVIVGAIAGDDAGAAWVLFALIATPGTLMISIGVIAKAVQVGIRSSRD
jgi:hypothetical protein